MNIIKFVVIGCSEFIISCTKSLIDNGCTVAAIIGMAKNQRPLNSLDLSTYAEKCQIPYFEIEDINSEDSVNLVKEIDPDFLFVSWPKIIKENLLEVPKRFAIGTHPTELPHNRGRHPLHWLLTLGISHSALSFFKMDKGVDTGEIIHQEPFYIDQNDAIADITAKVNLSGYNGVKALCAKLKSEAFKTVSQNDDIANYWRKKTPFDITLDPRMSAKMIINIVKSFTHPYPCALLLFCNTTLHVHSAKIFNTDLSLHETQRMENGKIFIIDKNRIVFKAENHLVEVFCDEAVPNHLIDKQYIYPPMKYILEYPQIAEMYRNWL